MSVLQKQVEAFEAQFQLLGVMLAGIKHTLSMTETPRVEVGPLPERCLEYDAEQCGRRNPDAIKRGGLGGPAREMCKGCGEDPRQE